MEKVKGYKVHKTTKEIVDAIVLNKYNKYDNPLVEHIQKAAYWFVSRGIPAYLRSEEAVWESKENFERVVHRTKCFCDLYDKGKVGISYSVKENGTLLRYRFGDTWYTLEKEEWF